MEIKGSIVNQLKEFIKTKHPSIYNQWLELVPDESKNIFSDIILTTNWYDMKYSLYEPKLIAAELLKVEPKVFFWEIGDYTAQNALKGIYKIFVKIATPHFLLNRSRSVVKTFYKNTNIEITKSEKNEAELKYIGFDDNCELIMYRIAGWIDSSLRFTRAKNVTTKIVDINKEEDFTFSVNVKWT
jgi:hypothetical protein